MYLYGFPEIDTTEKEHGFDSETMNLLIICLEVMYGIQGTNTSFKAMATAFGKGEKLMNTVLYKRNDLPNCKKCFKMVWR